MKKFYLIFALLFFSFAFNQERKYPSLLWEISGENLTKKSYLYGTMHVSEKVSYHLSDAFFKHLLEADFVANESDPATWNQVSDLYFSPYAYQNDYTKFYKKFVTTPIKRNDLLELFSYNRYSINSLLYRTNEYNSDFQEETYLDMFIYQIGRKYNKKVVGLEDVFQSIKMAEDIDADAIKPNIENHKLLTKLLNGKPYGEALKDYYREKNLDMIDSLHTLYSSPEELSGILYKRNHVMLKSMDSLMQKGSLFAAVGAAHLPGKKGLIESLREKGYKVKPVFSNYTEVSKNLKKQIDQLFISPKQTDFVSADKIIKAKVLEQIQYQFGGGVLSPDLANGSFMQIQRIPIHDFLTEKDKYFNHLSLDSLFYENIKGEIKSKLFSENGIIKKYDIKNKTKSGDLQRHQFYITPLEIIGVNLSGKSDYINKYESLIFDDFQLNIPQNGFKRITSKFGDFSLEMPNYTIIYGEESQKSKEDLQLYGYDSKTQTYYFLLENTSNNYYDLEEKAYELKRIHEEFLIEYDALSTLKPIKLDDNQYISNASIKNQNSYLKTIINGNKYYLLGIVNSSIDQANTFFDSFKFKSLKLDDDFKRYEVKDVLSFELPFEENKKIFLFGNTNKNQRYYRNNSKINHFRVKDREYIVNSLYFPSVKMNIKPFHKYQYETNADSIVTRIKNKLLNIKNDDFTFDAVVAVDEVADKTEFDENSEESILNAKDMSYYEYYGATNIGEIKSDWNRKLGFDRIKNQKFKIEQEKKYYDSDKKCEVFEGLLTKEESSQAIKFKYLISEQSIVELKTLVDKNNSKSEFLDRISQSIDYLPQNSIPSIYKGKWDIFLEDANSEHDSIRYSAMNSIEYLKLKNEDLKSVKDFIEQFSFKKEEYKYKNELISKVSDLSSNEALDYIKTLYRDTFDAQVQLTILNGLASQKDEKSYKIIDELLNEIIPIPDHTGGLDRLFKEFNENTKQSVSLVSTLLSSFFIPEYNEYVLSYLDALNTNKLLQKKHLKSTQKLIFSKANLELRRVQSFLFSKMNDENSEHIDTYDTIQDLLKYMRILYPYYSKSEVNNFYDKTLKLKVKEITLQYALLEKFHTKTINNELKVSLLNNPKTLLSTYLLLNDSKNNFNEFSEKDLRESAIIIIDDVDLEKQKMEYLFSKEKEFNGESVIFYFYKLSPQDKDETLNQIYGSKNILLSVGFVLDSNKKPIINTFYSGFQKEIEYDEKIDELSETVIDEALNKYRSKACSEKITSNQQAGLEYFPY
ncbi:MAG: TraB/GumN family protein [Flavobacteriales bacterium]|nr:TraB/GumN family protein [Flavobacteriales bacterium]